jgi:hypothetical protein
VTAYLDERRPLATALHVCEPRYLPICVKAHVRIWKRALATGLVASLDAVKAAIGAEIAAFLHPLHGGPTGDGWEVGQDVIISGLLERIQPDPDIGYVAELSVKADTPDYQPPDRPFEPSDPGPWVRLADYEIVCEAPEHEIEVKDV